MAKATTRTQTPYVCEYCREVGRGQRNSLGEIAMPQGWTRIEPAERFLTPSYYCPDCYKPTPPEAVRGVKVNLDHLYAALEQEPPFLKLAHAYLTEAQSVGRWYPDQAPALVKAYRAYLSAASRAKSTAAADGS